MASVVDTSVKHFHSGMAGAPVLNNGLGAMTALLDACLINGFDVKAATSLNVAAGVATVAFSGTHSAVLHSVILVAGSAVAALNGEQKITAVGAGFVKFATAAADGAAGGTISFKMAPLGWATVFTGTNKRVYQSTNPTSTKMLLRVEDTNAYQCKVRGFEQMTDVDTGLGRFPSVTSGGFWPKTWQDVATPVNWAFFGDSKMFLISLGGEITQNVAYTGQSIRGFGDPLALRPGGDPYGCFLNCHKNTETIPAVSSMNTHLASGTGATDSFFARDFTGLGGDSAYNCFPFTGSTTLSGCDSRLGDFPSKIDGSLFMSAKYFAKSTGSQDGSPRAVLPGLLHLAQQAAGTTVRTGNLIPGTGTLAGRTLHAINVVDAVNISYPNATQYGATLIDITGPWR